MGKGNLRVSVDDVGDGVIVNVSPFACQHLSEADTLILSLMGGRGIVMGTNKGGALSFVP